jgi:hypothetical protein
MRGGKICRAERFLQGMVLYSFSNPTVGIMRYKSLPKLPNFVTQTIISADSEDANDAEVVIYVNADKAQIVLKQLNGPKDA